ncbi:TPA: antA/AntB antirepressor family protein [Salmonella enterica subsp. diarizonae serovar 50:k:z]
MTTQLIPVFNGTINSEPTLLCNARDLHSFLAVGKAFAAWITSRLEEYGFAENQDYILLSNSGKQTSGRGGHNRKDYHLTLDTAKELAMVERNDKGRQIRRYFIECEKQLRQKSSEPKIVIPRRFLVTIHPDGYQETKAISDDAYILSAEDFLRMIVGRGITVDDELLVDFSLAMLQRVYRSQDRK